MNWVSLELQGDECYFSLCCSSLLFVHYCFKSLLVRVQNHLQWAFEKKFDVHKLEKYSHYFFLCFKDFKAKGSRYFCCFKILLMFLKDSFYACLASFPFLQNWIISLSRKNSFPIHWCLLKQQSHQHLQF